MIDWDNWKISHNILGGGDIRLLNIRAEIHIKLNPGHEVKQLSWCVPFGLEVDPNDIINRFKINIKEELK